MPKKVTFLTLSLRSCSWPHLLEETIFLSNYIWSFSLRDGSKLLVLSEISIGHRFLCPPPRLCCLTWTLTHLWTMLHSVFTSDNGCPGGYFLSTTPLTESQLLQSRDMMGLFSMAQSSPFWMVGVHWYQWPGALQHPWDIALCQLNAGMF